MWAALYICVAINVHSVWPGKTDTVDVFFSFWRARSGNSLELCSNSSDLEVCDCTGIDEGCCYA